jgi:trimethyllysine dioxygenase
MLTACPVFDNWRVLHGRSAFTGNRRMCGGYSEDTLCHMDQADKTVNRDDFISRFKMLNWGRDKVLRQVARG